MKDELDGKVMKELFGLRTKTHSYLKDNDGKKAKGTKKCVINIKLQFQDDDKRIQSIDSIETYMHME